MGQCRKSIFGVGQCRKSIFVVSARSCSFRSSCAPLLHVTVTLILQGTEKLFRQQRAKSHGSTQPSSTSPAPSSAPFTPCPPSQKRSLSLPTPSAAAAGPLLFLPAGHLLPPHPGRAAGPATPPGTIGATHPEVKSCWTLSSRSRSVSNIVPASSSSSGGGGGRSSPPPPSPSARGRGGVGGGVRRHPGRAAPSAPTWRRRSPATVTCRDPLSPVPSAPIWWRLAPALCSWHAEKPGPAVSRAPHALGGEFGSLKFVRGVS